VSFLDRSPEPFHVVETVIQELLAKGFSPLNEDDYWKAGRVLKKGGKYFYTRNKSSIVAFVVGEKYSPGSGFKVLGAHTDSPNLRIKPRSKRSGSGLVQVNVETYGGGLWGTWFDRDLSVAGRVLVRHADGGLGFRLLKIDRPVLNVPSLCIHLRTPEEREAMKINKEDHLSPILCAQVASCLAKSQNEVEMNNGMAEEMLEDDQWASAQQPEFLGLLAEEIGCSPADIVDFELSLFDTQGATLSGRHKEFIAGSRLDNLASCFVAIESLITHADAPRFAEDDMVSLVALYDHEEVGSNSNTGAGSPMMRDAVSRISDALSSSNDSELYKVALSKSLILSIDMAHAQHPNYAAKHEKGHAPQMNCGVVIKSNSNQRYATTGVTGYIIRELARKAALPIQEFVVRNDCPCGSTIGPIISANTGIRAVDLGMPQLSMHSIREMMGVSDLTFAHKLFTEFFASFAEVDAQLRVDSH
jgi:aspartyl aminopeptidase